MEKVPGHGLCTDSSPAGRPASGRNIPVLAPVLAPVLEPGLAPGLEPGLVPGPFTIGKSTSSHFANSKSRDVRVVAAFSFIYYLKID